MYIADASCSQAAAAQAEKKLLEERATLSRYDEELKSLERAIKEKKQAISDVELQIQQREHEITTLKKEKVGAENQAANLEKQHEWIAEERE